jgi:hypothetical protein
VASWGVRTLPYSITGPCHYPGKYTINV